LQLQLFNYLSTLFDQQNLFMMKKIVLLTATFCLLCIYSCTSKLGEPNDNQIILDHSKSETDWTTNKELQKWHNQYLNDQSNATYKKDTQTQPYQYVDFKLEELKHLVWLMEKSANNVYAKNGKEKPELGLRVYYTQYTEGDSAGINSVVLSPVFRDGNSNKLFNPRSTSQKDAFIPWDMGQQFGGLIKGTNPRNLMMFYFQRDNEGTNLNHGMNCPDRCE